MLSRSAWLHLRIPFSYFLLPVFLFCLCISPNFNESRILWVFVILHFLLYPASNGYNSYFDKDEKSIGGLKHPPPVNKGLYFLSLLLDGIALILGFVFVNPTFAFMLFIYGLVSKAYSHPAIRIKKYAWWGWLTVGIFQGAFTFIMCYVGLNNFSIEVALRPTVIFPAGLTSILLLGTYPMTQIYQHEEDRKRGDHTLSSRLGIPGTFYFVASVFTVAAALFLLYFKFHFSEGFATVFLMALIPVLVFFFYWFLLVLKDERNANFKNAMRLNFLSATCLNAFFIYLFLENTQITQVFP